MPTEIFLVAPSDAPNLVERLRATLATTEVAALLLQRGGLGDAAYRDIARSIIPAAQAAGAAVLLEGEPQLVRALGADGLHVTGGASVARSAVAALKPDFIVGAGNLATRHAAMEMGELGLDYVQFGPLSGAISEDGRELARWWAQTMEIPSVLSDPEASLTAYEAEGCEFVGLPLAALEPRA